MTWNWKKALTTFVICLTITLVGGRLVDIMLLHFGKPGLIGLAIMVFAFGLYLVGREKKP